MSWHLGFAAVSALLREPPDHVVAAMGGDEDAAAAAHWFERLGAASRDERAGEIARAIAPIAADIEHVRIV